jgi:hypothetical protein
MDLAQTVEIHTKEIDVLEKKIEQISSNQIRFEVDIAIIKHELTQQNTILFTTNQIVDRIEKHITQLTERNKMQSSLLKSWPSIIGACFLIALIFDMPSIDTIVHSLFK